VTETIVALSGIEKTFFRGKEAIHVLDNLDLDVPGGSFEALMGPSGSGKSTLLNIIAGLDRPTRGTVKVAGADLTTMSDKQLARWRSQTIGFVFQSFNLIPVLTAAQNVELPLLLTQLTSAQRKAHVATALRIVGLEDRMDHYPRQLSGGQEQRVAIARAIVKRPDVLLCDEPTGALDYQTGKLVLEVIARINRDLGTTAVVITHNAAIAGMADRVIHLGDGRILRSEHNAHKISPEELVW